MSALDKTFGTSEEKALRDAAALVDRAKRSQSAEDDAWSADQWSSFRDDLVMFSLYELPVLLRLAASVGLVEETE